MEQPAPTVADTADEFYDVGWGIGWLTLGFGALGLLAGHRTDTPFLWGDPDKVGRDVLVGFGLVGLSALTVFFISTSQLPYVSQFRHQTWNRVGPLVRGLSRSKKVGFSVFAGVGEEILFRGFLLGFLAIHLPPTVAIGLSAAAFGAAHFLSSRYVFFATLIGVLWGTIYWWTGNLWIPIVVHALHDMLAFAFVGYWPDGVRPVRSNNDG